MTPDQWRRVNELFDAACQIPAAERSGWLRKASGDDFLKQATRQLLEADEQAIQQGFLNLPQWEHRARSSVNSHFSESAEQAAFRHGFTPKPVLLEQRSAALATETALLIRKRLRAIALTYLCIFGILPFWRLFVGRTTDFLVTALSAIVVLLLAVIVNHLSSSGDRVSIDYRKLELGMLGMLAGLVTTIYSRQLLRFALANHLTLMQVQMEHFTLYSVMLILTFGLATPKRWLQTVLTVIPLVLLPFVSLIILCWLYPPVLSAVRNWTEPREQLSFQAMILLIVAAGTVYESQSTRQLRRQVAKALQLNQYHLRRKIGFGGMGEVYLAEHQLLKRACAVKLIRPRNAEDPTVLARFEREVQATAKLAHPNIVEIYDYGRSDDGTYYYVMEYLSGMSLEQLIKRHGALPPGRVVFLMRQICLALESAHAAGMVHRDIKPSNIMVTCHHDKYDIIKLLDFGLVLSAAGLSATPHLTKEGQVFGTPLFMPPEQITKGSRVLDERSDLYALGAVGYFLLTGRPPFDREQDLDAILAHAVEPVVPPSQLSADVPDDLDRIILHCLVKKPEERISSAHSLEQRLAHTACSADWNDEKAAQWWQEQSVWSEESLETPSSMS